MKMIRRSLLRLVGVCAVLFFAAVYVYYYSIPGSSSYRVKESRGLRWALQTKGGQVTPSDACVALKAAKTDVNTVEQFPKFEFQPAWMREKEFWDANFEKRYLKRRNKWKMFPLKVILMPHSHNDPGWLRTYEEYYFHQTSKIIRNMIEKLKVHSNMTFIWSEITYLSLWYDRAHPTLRQQLKDLVNSGRVEITTGGWIMTDEATVHLYSMIDQLIEGHQWLNLTLGVKPVYGWAVDTFGHGAALPYILKEAGIEGTVIQRIHYSWKQWLAEQQLGDFLWRQSWDPDGQFDLLTHNRPYDIYSIKHSCGPNPQICLNFDFRKVQGEYTEYSIKSVPIDINNVKAKAELLLDQYGRTGSLYPHNVVLVPIGDDFRYDHSMEWDQQYTNYQRIIDWINSDPDYNAEIKWGTLKDYFSAIRDRMKGFPLLQGDFFVYSDIFTEGRPAYWSGYFTTRPYWKVLDRELENLLRSAEILYTWALSRARQLKSLRRVHILEKDYERLVRSRRHLALFQHHDAITGTSKAAVMHDYGMKLFEGIVDTMSISAHSVECILVDSHNTISKDEPVSMSRLQSDVEYSSYDKLPRKIPVSVTGEQEVVLFNSLAQQRVELIKILVKSSHLKVVDEQGRDVLFQINPVWNNTGSGMIIVSSQFELMFLATVPPLSLVKYAIQEADHVSTKKAVVYSNFYTSSKHLKEAAEFETREVLPGDIQLESDRLKLLFEGSTGLLRSVTDKRTSQITQTLIRYAAYPSAQFKSGAYLFKPDPNARESEEDVLSGAVPHIFIYSGPLISELTVMFGSVLIHTTRIFHVTLEPLASAVYMENSVDFSNTYNSTATPSFPPHYRETELFMRITTDIDNGQVPEFYTDQNGLSMQKRIKVKSIGVQGNYYPITMAAYLEDSALVESRPRRRLTLLVDHSMGAASWEQGWLEVMVERRMFYDDARGMGEGVTDQKRTPGQYWLLVEELQNIESVPTLSLAAHHLSASLTNAPLLFLVASNAVGQMRSVSSLINKPFPCSLHVLNFRVLSEGEFQGLTPSSSAVLLVQNQIPSCVVKAAVSSCESLEDSPSYGTVLSVDPVSLEETDLTAGKSKKTLQSLSDIKIPQRQVKTYRLTFHSA